MRQILGFFGIIAVIGTLVYLGIGSNEATKSTAKESDANPTNLLENKAFLKDNPKYVPAIRKLIVTAGYECPALTFLWLRGYSPYGNKLEALCGPAGAAGNSYPSLHYAIYPDRLKVDLCKEYGVFGGDCP